MKKLIIGLGNPGNKYTNTRHNAGFVALDYLADQLNSGEFNKSGNADALVADVVIGGRKVKLVKPQTFMNKSGQAVSNLADYFDVSAEDVLIIHDDIDLPLGKLRMSFDSSAGGHNGVRSVIDELGTRAFPRLRIGIVPTDKKGSTNRSQQISARDFVLQKFSKKEQESLTKTLPDLREITDMWVKEGVEEAMNKLN